MPGRYVARLDAAFGRVPWLLPGPATQVRLRMAVNRLAIIAAAAADRPAPGPPVAFEVVGRSRSLAELEAVAAAADPDALAAALAALHEPAILALANHGIVRELAPGPNLSARARAAAGSLATLPDPKGGRRPNNLRRVVALLVVEDFEALSGGDPDKPGSSAGLVRLAREVYAVLGIHDADPRAAIAAALEERRRRAKA